MQQTLKATALYFPQQIRKQKTGQGDKEQLP